MRPSLANYVALQRFRRFVAFLGFSERNVLHLCNLLHHAPMARLFDRGLFIFQRCQSVTNEIVDGGLDGSRQVSVLLF